MQNILIGVSAELRDVPRLSNSAHVSQAFHIQSPFKILKDLWSWFSYISLRPLELEQVDGKPYEAHCQGMSEKRPKQLSEKRCHFAPPRSSRETSAFWLIAGAHGRHLDLFALFAWLSVSRWQLFKLTSKATHIARKVILAADWRCLSCWSTVDPRAAMKNWFWNYCFTVLFQTVKRECESDEAVSLWFIKSWGYSFDHIDFQWFWDAATFFLQHPAWQSCRLVLLGWSCIAGLVPDFVRLATSANGYVWKWGIPPIIAIYIIGIMIINHWV